MEVLSLKDRGTNVGSYHQFFFTLALPTLPISGLVQQGLQSQGVLHKFYGTFTLLSPGLRVDTLSFDDSQMYSSGVNSHPDLKQMYFQ